MSKNLILLNRFEYLTDSVDDELGIQQKLRLLSQMNLDSTDMYGNRKLFNTDSNESIFVANQLQNIENEVYLHKLAPNKFMEAFPIEPIPDGAEEIGYDEQQMNGKADIVANGSDDIPSVNVFKSRNLQGVFSIMTQYSFSYDTIQNALYANVPLSSDLGVAGRMAIEQAHNTYAFSGNSTYGINGLTSSGKLSSYTDAGVTTNWMASGTTSAQIIADVNTIVNLIATTSKEIYDSEKSDIVFLVPIEVKTKLQTMPYSSSQQALGSVWTYIKTVHPRLRMIATDKMKDALTSGKNACFAFPYDKSVLSYGMVPMRQLPTVNNSINYKTFLRSRTAGLKYKQPKLIVYTNISA